MDTHNFLIPCELCFSCALQVDLGQDGVIVAGRRPVRGKRRGEEEGGLAGDRSSKTPVP